MVLSLIHISEPTRHLRISYAVAKRLGARGTNSGDLMTHPDTWPHRNALLKGATPS